MRIHPRTRAKLLITAVFIYRFIVPRVASAVCRSYHFFIAGEQSLHSRASFNYQLVMVNNRRAKFDVIPPKMFQQVSQM